MKEKIVYKATSKHNYLRDIYFKARRASGRTLYKDYFHNTKSIFIHIPKAAGKSVSQSLYGDDKPGHYYAYDYKNESQIFFSSYFKFAFVRHPLDRAYSAYSFLTKGGSTQADKRMGELIKEKFKTFDHFANNWLCCGNEQSWVHFIPQSLFTHTNGALSIDFIGKFETIQTDFELIKEKVNPSAALIKINKTPNKKETKFSEETIERIYKTYKDDYLNFNYEK